MPTTPDSDALPAPAPAPPVPVAEGLVRVTTPEGKTIVVSPQVARGFAGPVAPQPPSLIPFQTALAPTDETNFQRWIIANKIPFDSSPKADYDMRGYWKALQSGDKRAVQAENKHFPDTWKTPYHETFSNESMYATPLAPHWQGDRLVDWRGNVIADESPKPTTNNEIYLTRMRGAR